MRALSPLPSALTRRFGCACALSVVSCVAILSAQQQASQPQPPTRPTFRTGVNNVLVDLRVEDRNGKFVADLKKEDFHLFEDDVEQTINNFTLINIPIETRRETSTRTLRVEPDVASNGQTVEGRLYLIVLDDGPAAFVDPRSRNCEAERRLEVYQSHPLRTPTVRALARDFVENHLASIDQAAVVTISGRSDMREEFTAEPARLLAAIDRFQGSFGSHTATCDAGRTLASFATWLSQIEGRRKAIVYVTEKVDLIGDDQLERLLIATARANVSLYIIDPTGVPTGKMFGIKPVPLDDVLNIRDQMARRMDLEVLAEATGGQAFGTHSNDYTKAFETIVEENSSYYVLAYTPTNTAQDGKQRKLRVEVRRPNGDTSTGGFAKLHVRSREAYVAAKAEPDKAAPPNPLPADLAALMKSPIAVSGLTLSLSAVPYRFDSNVATVSVVVEARASDLFFASQDARFNGAMDLAIVATNWDGKPQGGERGTLTMRLLPETHDTVAMHGVRFLSTLQLKPGRYHIAAAATDAGGGPTRGSVRYDLTVPDFTKPTIGLSGLALTSTTAGRTPTNGADAKWKALGIVPTTMRAFSPDEVLRGYAEVYDRDTIAGHRVTLVTTVRDAAGRSVFTRRENLPPIAPELRQTITQQVTTEVPLKDMTAGEYVLTVEARHSNTNVAPATRQLPFTVRAGR